MPKSILLVFFLLGSIYCNAQYPGFVLLKETEDFKKDFSKATSETKSIQSDFSQQKTLSMLSENILSKGKFWFLKKNKLRMEYLQPYKYLMILNEGKIYLKDGQNENKISANSNKIFRQVNRILVDCVTGNMLDNPDFQSRIFENTGSYLIELRPEAPNMKDLYKNINISIDKKDYSANKIEMYETGGDKTIIRFQNKIINAQIPVTIFDIP